MSSRQNSLQKDARLRGIVDEHLHVVARVLRNAGVSASQLDDEIQRTLMTVARRLEDIRPGAEKSFVIQIALRVAAHARRTVARRREVDADEANLDSRTTGDPATGFGGSYGGGYGGSYDDPSSPERLMDQKRMREHLDRVLDGMDGALRDIFVLYEFEELSMLEIASVLGIPQGTVASRLRRARSIFRERIVELGLIDSAIAPKVVGS